MKYEKLGKYFPYCTRHRAMATTYYIWRQLNQHFVLELLSTQTEIKCVNKKIIKNKKNMIFAWIGF